MLTAEAPALSPLQLARRWREIDDAGIPEGCRAELDEFGELVLSPLPTSDHQFIAGSVADQLKEALGGKVWVFAVTTKSLGVRIPDVCWMPDLSRYRTGGDLEGKAPDICVEVASPGNTRVWLLRKASAYLDAGAHEVVIVELDGRIRYYGPEGERERSAYGLVLTVPPAPI